LRKLPQFRKALPSRLSSHLHTRRGV
jgi:hypothetical protein